MTRFRLPVLATTLVLIAGQAQAQNFFERLFGLVPDRPAAPTYQPQPEAAMPVERPPPIQARPVAFRVPTEDTVVGRDLKLNGASGLIRIERAGGDLRAKLTFGGRRAAQSADICQITLGGRDGVRLVSQPRTDGLQSYQIQDPAIGCGLDLEIVEEAVLIKGKVGESCLIQTMNCVADPVGMWGPEPGQLLPKAALYEAARGAADKAVRENYKVMVQRARPEAIRSIVAEQAGFSSEREVLCRTYAKEGSHSFCNARFSEARVIALAQRLGVTYASATLDSPQRPNPADYRARRRADPYSLPATDEISPRPFRD